MLLHGFCRIDGKIKWTCSHECFSYLSSVVSFASLRRPATENKKQVVESKLFDPIKGRSTIVFPDDNVAWQSLALEKGFRVESVSHQRKQFTRTVSETTRRQASLAGTQMLDRSWRSLKDWMPQGFHPSEKKNGHTCQSWMLAHLVYQWAWRQSIGSCSPAEFLELLHELVQNP